MSGRKFASVTGDLLIRKGNAEPSAARYGGAKHWSPAPPPMPRAVASIAPVPSSPLFVRPSAPPPAQPATVSDKSEPMMKIALKLSQGQHFRMRVAAAQLQVSRQALVSAALDHYLTTVCAAGLPECKCLGSGKGCACSG